MPDQRASLIIQANKLAQEKFAIEVKERDQQLYELRILLKEAQSNELELRKREHELQLQKEQLRLEVARQLDSERETIRSEAKQLIEEQHQMKDAEKEKMIGNLRKQIDELKRKAKQGSQQTQGEVQELALKALLGSSFPSDTIEPIAKGVRGGDAVQRVHDSSGLNCGGILWESKRSHQVAE